MIESHTRNRRGHFWMSFTKTAAWGIEVSLIVYDGSWQSSALLWKRRLTLGWELRGD